MSKELTRNRALAESFMNQLSAVDTETERAFITELVDQITTPIKKIPEPVFHELFLPYFLGEKKPDANNDPIAHWIGLVGSASEPAEVVNVKGETLFQVPPMMDSSRLNITDRKNTTNFATIFSQYQEQSIVHPSLGKRYLIEELSKKADMNLTDTTQVSQNSWEGVLQYYHLDEATAEIKQKAHALIDEDDLDFG